MDRSGKKKRGWPVVAGLVILAAVAAGFILWNAIRYDKNSAGSQRIGDEQSDAYEWQGHYYDSGTMTTLTIERAGNDLEVSISHEDENNMIALWSFTCSYNSSLGILTYKDAVRTNVTIIRTDGAEDDVSFDTRTVYEEGSGYLYLKENVIHWVDDEESFGDGMMFERL